MNKRSHTDVGRSRREQIIEAAVAIIAEKGLQHLSLSEIETRAGMSRGQLTYYFPAKEEILLAVFDRLLELLREQAHGHGCGVVLAHGWERAQHFLTLLILQPPRAPEFNALQYTFLSQIGHRDDFRQRLANLYEEWRGEITRDIEFQLAQRPGAAGASARTVATLIQAILHGLAMQREADPESYNRPEMLKLVLDLLGSYLRPPGAPAGAPRPTARKSVPANGSSGRGAARRSSRSPRVKHE
jgi:AcrR family transcriptional regulator